MHYSLDILLSLIAYDYISHVVRVCRSKHTKEVVAIKKMKKAEMLQKN